MHELPVIASTFLVSLISFVGVLTLALKERMLNQALLLLVALSAGALMGGAFFHLIPEAIATCMTSEQMESLFGYVIVGFTSFFLLEKILHWRHMHEIEHVEHGVGVRSFGYMNFIGDAVHNFIDGLVIAASFLTSFTLGVASTLAIIFHEIPQEIGDFGVLLHSGFKKEKAILLNFVTALSAILGGVVGLIVATGIDGFVSVLLPIAAGGFIYIASSDLIPEIRGILDARKSALSFAVFLLGVLFMWLAKLLFA